MNDSEKERIYLDPKLNTIPDYYDRDIVKVLTKNLKEAYVFWGISSDSFNKILNAFECEKDQVYFKLMVNYAQEDKVHRNKEILLPPFTNNWFLQFEQRIKNLKVEVIAYSQAGNTYSLLHSAEISIPNYRPSKVLHKDWLKSAWVEQHHVVDINGELHIREGEKTVDVEKHNFIGKLSVSPTFTEPASLWQEEIFSRFDGSSGFMGSSGIFTSSNHKGKIQ